MIAPAKKQKQQDDPAFREFDELLKLYRMMPYTKAPAIGMQPIGGIRPLKNGIKFVWPSVMKQEFPPLVSFIKDYGLEKPNGVICFTASIHFHSKKNWFKFVSPVHIVTISIKHLDVIYLLNPEIDTKKINTMYSNNETFNYSDTRRFEIKGSSERYGDYSLFIIPISKNCGDETIIELHAKKNN